MLKVILKRGYEKQRFEIDNYPDGQRNIRLNMEYFNDPKQLVHIKCHIKHFDDLEILLSVVSALRKHDYVISHITFNYLFGMRSDRAFKPGMPNYFRDVVAPIINNIGVKVNVLCPHSEIALRALKNASAFMRHDFPDHEYCMLGADQSAGWYNIFKDIDNYPYFYKVRSGGELTISLREDFRDIVKSSDKPILVFDDLCDGGRTFITIADYLSKHFPDREKHLFICHGIFSNGVDHVAQHFDKVITTNSYQEFKPHEKLEVIDVWSD